MMRRIILTLSLLGLAACGGQSAVPDDHFYRLAAPQVAAATTLTDGVIFVEQFIAAGIQRERPLVYAESSAPTELLQRHYHFWMDSPSRMLRDQLVDYLRAANAGKVITDVPAIPAQLSIFGKIRRLEHVMSSGSSQVVVALEFRVQKAGSDVPVFVRQYEQTVDLNNRSIDAAVAAFGTALSAIYAQLVQDVVAA